MRKVRKGYLKVVHNSFKSVFEQGNVNIYQKAKLTT